MLTVIHLLYATGHTAHSGEALVRDELTGRALDLARMLRVLLPAEREAAGLLALLLVHHARRATRTDADGRLLRLDEQDRSAWDRDADRRGRPARGGGARAPARPGASRCRRRSPRCTRRPPTYAETDWPQILTLYDELLRIWPSPVVALNRAVAVVDGRRAGGRAGRGRGARARRPAGRLPLPARDQGRPAAPPRPRRRGGRGLPRARWRSATTPPSRSSSPSARARPGARPSRAMGWPARPRRCRPDR